MDFRSHSASELLLCEHQISDPGIAGPATCRQPDYGQARLVPITREQPRAGLLHQRKLMIITLAGILTMAFPLAHGFQAEEPSGPSSTPANNGEMEKADGPAAGETEFLDSSISSDSTESSESSQGENGKDAANQSPEQKALNELQTQLKEMEDSVDFPVGQQNRLLTENRAAYDKRDLSALAQSLLSRKQLYGIVIWKSKHRLSVFDQRGVEILTFDAGIGGDAQGGLKPKQFEYDGRTPEGIYRIFRFYSLDAPKKSESYKELERLNGYFLTAKLGYSLYGKPGKDAGKNVFGPRFYGIDYPAASDIWRYKMALKEGSEPLDKKRKLPMRIGSGIAIHGTNDPASVGQTFGSGCIRLRNEDIVKLDPFMNNGMPVIIFP